jgi:hypothetical protein
MSSESSIIRLSWPRQCLHKIPIQFQPPAPTSLRQHPTPSHHPHARPHSQDPTNNNHSNTVDDVFRRAGNSISKKPRILVPSYTLKRSLSRPGVRVGSRPIPAIPHYPAPYVLQQPFPDLRDPSALSLPGTSRFSLSALQWATVQCTFILSLPDELTISTGRVCVC